MHMLGHQVNIAFAAPPPTVVGWRCLRCGHRGGVAKTTLPLDCRGSEDLWAMMLAQLRKKLVRVHQRSQGCIAIPDDFVIHDYIP